MTSEVPRWRHKCPGCRKVVYYEYVYCNQCRAVEPQRKNFRLDGYRGSSGLSSYRKGPYYGLTAGMRLTRDHLFALVKAFVLCVECGHKVRPDSLRHRCYFLTDQSVRTLSELKCRVCKQKKPKHLFPQFKRRGKLLWSRVCSTCLHDTEVLVPKKRRYERRVTA